MATIINNPSSRNNAPADSGVDGFMFGLIVLLIVLAVLLFAYYGIPALRHSGSNAAPSTTNNINIPAPSSNNGTNGNGGSGGGATGGSSSGSTTY